MDKYIYFVEGYNEENVVNTLKDIKNRYIVAGKCRVLNIAQEEIKGSHLMTLNKSTVAIVIYDNDVIIDRKTNPEKAKEKVNKNIKLLKEYCKQVIVICQYDNIEDEIKKSTNVTVRELLNSKSEKEAKSDLRHEKNLMKKLLDKNFDFNKFWQGTIPEYIKKQVETHKKIRLK